MSKLKPCEKCGSSNVSVGVFSDALYRGLCQDCGHGYENWEYSGEEAIKAWNTRPIEDELRKQLAEKDAEIAKFRAENEKLRSMLFGYVNNECNRIENMSKEELEKAKEGEI